MIIHPYNPQIFQQIVEHLRAGEVVAIPTETVYGLAADAKNPEAIKKIFHLKERPFDNPIIVHLPDQESMEQWGKNIPEYAWELAKAFWPGPLTLIIPKADSVLNLLTADQASVGVRVPAHPIALAILQAFDGGLAAPSANPFTRISPTQSSHVAEYFGEELWIVEGGPSEVGLESTIVDCTGKYPVILRHGVITEEDILEKINGSLALLKTSTAKHPGQHKRHYAPQTPIQLLDQEALSALCQKLTSLDKQQMGLIALTPSLQNLYFKKSKILPRDSKSYGASLYSALHELDAEGAQIILIEMPPDLPEWRAVREKLFKAQGERSVPDL